MADKTDEAMRKLLTIKFANLMIGKDYPSVGQLVEAAQTASPLTTSERFDYERLKNMEVRGIESYRKMRKAKALTAEAVLSFINQLSPWNLETTGKSILDAYVAKTVTTKLLKLKQDMAMHTVPEGRGLVTRYYLNNAIDFEIAQLQEESKT